MLLNSFPEADLRPEVELMHLLRMPRHYCHVWNKHWTYSEFAWTLSCIIILLYYYCYFYVVHFKIQAGKPADMTEILVTWRYFLFYIVNL